MFKKVIIKKGKKKRKGDFMKKVISLILSMAMVLSLTVLSFAAGETYSITINNDAKEDHNYQVYQIFTGDLSDKGVLSNIQWGSGVTSAGQTALGNAAAKAETLTDANVKEFAKGLVDDGYLTNPASLTKNGNEYSISGLAPGYYLVKDEDNSLAGKDDSYTSYIVKVVKDVNMAPKSSQPTVQKKVKDTNDSVADSTTDWQDSADYDIGDDVPFQLKATLPKNVTAYDTYKVEFHDTLSEGLTYNNDAVIKIGDVDVTSSFTKTYEGTTLTFTCNDVKALGAGNESVITIEYTAKLNEKAKFGATGNPNEVYLKYSNNPNNSGTGDNETGETPKDKVIVFTYKTVINKIDANKQSLAGAAFALQKYDADKDEWVTIKDYKDNNNNNTLTSFEFTGLDDGKYRLVETVTPAGYNTIDPIEFTVTAEHDIESDNPALTLLSGNVTTGEITFKPNVDEGSLTTDVINKSGATLPETGGIGTTIFYVVGAVLVIGAGVLFVTKRRMSAR